MFFIIQKIMVFGLCLCYKILKYFRNDFCCLFLIEQYVIIYFYELFLYCVYVNNFISYKSNCKGIKFVLY